MAETTNWTKFFKCWPEQVPRKGIVTDTHGEANPFKSFLLSGDMVLFERTNPDALGARFIMLGFEAISAVKITDPLRVDAFHAMGFEGTLSV